MRTGALALLLLMASCGQGDRVNQANQGEARAGVGGPQSGTERPAPTITIAATGPGGCAASWDGEQATPEQIKDRGMILVMHAIERAGGARNISEETIPILTVEAPAGLRFACADTILASIQRVGMASVRLRPAGQSPVLADFPLATDAPPPPIEMAIGVGASGLTWNGAPIAPDALAARLRQMGSDGAPGPGEMAAPPGGLELRPSPEATFGQVHAVLRTLRRRQIRPVLILSSIDAGPSGPAAPPSPPPPPGG
jgi:hypothetical protein